MMDKYLEENGYVNDFTDERRHHEIYYQTQESCTGEMQNGNKTPDKESIN